MAVGLGRRVTVAVRVAVEVVVAVRVGAGALVDVGGNAVGAGNEVGCGGDVASWVAVDVGCDAAGGVTTATAAGEAVATPAVSMRTGTGVPEVTPRLGALLHAPNRIAAITATPRTARIDIGK